MSRYNDLPENIQKVLHDLDDALLQDDLGTNDRDTLQGIKACLLKPAPIPAYLQDAYITYLANKSTPDKFGKLKGE